MKVVIGQKKKVTNLMCNVLVNLYKINKYHSNWIKSIHNMLNDVGMSYVWENQDNLGYTRLKKDILSIVQRSRIVSVNYVK